MKKVLNIHGKEPCILHLPGNGLKRFEDNISYLKDKKFNLKNKDSILFFTICTPNVPSPLIYQLKKNNIFYINLYDYIKDDILKFNTSWNWMYKHIALRRYFNSPHSKTVNENTLCLLLDARDIYLNNIDNIYNLFHDKFYKKIVFCGSRSDYPNSIAIGENYKVLNTVKSKFPVYLNAGGIITLFSRLKKLNEKLLEYNKTGYVGSHQLKDTLRDDDQYICKMIQQYIPEGFNQYELYVDEYAQFFQTLCLGELIETDNGNYIVT